jgi:hypothetical protein
MSSDVKIPEWVEQAAFEAQTAAIKECRDRKLFVITEYPFVTGAAKEVLDQHIARALLAAERRGLEKAAGYVVAFARTGAKERAEMRDMRMVNLFAQMEAVLPAAIRSLGEQE